MLARWAAYALIVGGNPDASLCRWDCSWYGSIAQLGYVLTHDDSSGRLQRAWPFFPVTPLLIGLAHRVGSPRLPDAAALIGALCSFGIAVLGVPYRALTRRRATASTWLLLSVFTPFGLYFATGYSEAPYALLALATLLALARGNPFLASVPCALLLVTRPSGVVLAPAIGLACLRRAWHEPTASARALAFLPCVITGAGLLAWMAYCAATVGDPIAFVHAQAAWNRHLSDPVRVLRQSLRAGLLDPRHQAAHLGYEGAWALAGLLIACLALLARRWAEALLLGGTVLLALSSGNSASMPRFVGANPVFMLAVADLADCLHSRPARTVLIAGSAALNLLLFRLWTLGWHGLV